MHEKGSPSLINGFWRWWYKSFFIKCRSFNVSWTSLKGFSTNTFISFCLWVFYKINFYQGLNAKSTMFQLAIKRTHSNGLIGKLKEKLFQMRHYSGPSIVVALIGFTVSGWNRCFIDELEDVKSLANSLIASQDINAIYNIE